MRVTPRIFGSAIVAGLCVLVGDVVAQIRTPGQAVQAAAADLQSLGSAASHVSTRYLWIGGEYAAGEPTARRAELIVTLTRVMSGHVNHLSTEPDLVAPVPVAGGWLLRLDVDNYGAENWRKTWERLADVDPDFHVATRVVEDAYWPGGVWSGDGKHYAAGPFKQARKVTAIAPWVAETPAQRQAVAYLIQRTQSQVPIVRADWFLWQTAIQVDRGRTGYYDWLGVKNQRDFERLVGFDAKLLQATKRRELLEAVAESGVAEQPRRIAAFNTVGGMRLWRTFDNRIAKDRNNPLRVLDQEFRFDASEDFGPLSNDLWAFGLFDKDGVKQESAPDFIGFDKTAHSNDGRIHIGLSCIRCHYPDNGLKPIDAWARNLFRTPLVLQSPDPAKARELRQQYLRSLEGPLEDDRRKFTRALFEITGMTPAQYATAFGDVYARYDAGVTLERAAADLGVTPGFLQCCLWWMLEATGNLDVVLSNFLLPRERRRNIGIRQWHEAYPLAQLAIRGLVAQ